MPTREKKLMFGAAFLTSVLSFVIICVVLGTQRWISSTVDFSLSNSSSISVTITYGLFSGTCASTIQGGVQVSDTNFQGKWCDAWRWRAMGRLHGGTHRSNPAFLHPFGVVKHWGNAGISTDQLRDLSGVKSDPKIVDKCWNTLADSTFWLSVTLTYASEEVKNTG